MSSVSKEIISEIHPSVYDILDEVGVPRRLTGYDELAVAVQIAATNPAEKLPLSKVIYPAVAEKFGVTPGSVERSIRTCIHKVFTMTPSKVLVKYFRIYPSDGVATNSHFIYTLAYEVHKLM